MRGKYNHIADVVEAYLLGWTLACLLFGALIGAGIWTAVRGGR